ncbi:MAG TPA: alpha/beta hydrolase [Acidimicrobiales bacterium]|nr:alpha/beta hydrolase [Acidimicrobiales bacterium]
MPSTTTADGVRIDYDVAGSGDVGMVFVHGWSCDRSHFEPQVAHFAVQHRVASIDLRGHGSSEQPHEGYAIDDFVRDVVAVTAAERMEAPVVVGHSMGGVVALAAAAAGAARAAVMVDPAPIVGGGPAFITGFADSLADDGDAALRTAFVDSMFLPTDEPERRARITAAMTARPLHIAIAAIRGIADFDGHAALQACAVPLLSIGSANPSNRADLLRKGCAHIVIGQTVGAGHFNQLEVPHQVNAMIEKFLEISG